MEREEYNRDTNPYPSFGKKYNSERAIISLTSWTARINTVSKTLYSLLTQCPGFHIVLVLSEEEFPKMMDELPENLKLFVDNELVEVLWVYKNYKSFKKVLFTMDKYRTVPVISADDDCIYTCNYAQILYDEWIKNPCKICSSSITHQYGFVWGCGACSLYPPHSFNLSNVNLIFSCGPNDDAFYSALAKHLKIHFVGLNIKWKGWFMFHDDVLAMSKSNIYNVQRDLNNFYNNIRV